MSRTVSLYHNNLKKTTQARAYLAQRGLDNPELIATFRLGYAHKNLGSILPARTSQAGKTARSELKSVGITLASGMERFSGSLVVPVLHQDQVLEMYGRKVTPAGKLRPGTARHLYLPGTHGGVWNQAGLSGDTVILCEALLDAMSFWVHGFTHVTSSYGVNGFTPSHLAVLTGTGVTRVLIAYDNDEAGNRAALALSERLQTQGIAPWRVLLPLDTDVNALMVGSSHPARALENLLTQAVQMQPANETAETSDATNTSPVPAGNAQPVMEQRGQDWHAHFDNRHYRVRGLALTPQGPQLRINLMLRVDDGLHIDSVDLYQSKQRQRFTEEASALCGVGEALVRQDLGRLLLALEEQQQSGQEVASPVDSMTEQARQDAMALLRHPDLLARIVSDFTACGVVGEQSNTLVGYLACVSRKLKPKGSPISQPLSPISQPLSIVR